MTCNIEVDTTCDVLLCSSAYHGDGDVADVSSVAVERNLKNNDISLVIGLKLTSLGNYWSENFHWS